MDTFAPSTDISLTFDMSDEETAEIIEPVSANYDLFDDEGVQLVNAEPVPVSGGEDELTITIDANMNTITGTEGARTAVLNVTTASGVKMLSKTYLLARFSILSVPAESGMTLAQSEMLTVKMAQAVLENWPHESDKRKTGALREAWNRLSRIPFSPWREFQQVPTTTQPYLRSGDFALNDITADDWISLPENFRRAVMRAQLIEAAVILDGDPTWDRRQDGLISKTVGESSEMFTSKKAAFTAISPKAQREVSAYIRRRISIGRA